MIGSESGSAAEKDAGPRATERPWRPLLFFDSF